MLSPHGLQQRSDLLQAVRGFFLARSYIEVDTPVRLPVLIPESEILPVSSGDWFLQTSPELCMKQLLARGCSRLFQICHCFRREEIGSLHREEFTLLEWYHVGWSYVELMEECEEMICAAAPVSAQGTDSILYREEREIALSRPWRRMTVEEAFLHYSGMSAQEAVNQGCFDEILVSRVEPNLGWERPVFLYDYPLALASLARPKAENPKVAERFELYIGGLELANGFSELTDPAVQEKRFGRELEKIREAGRRQAMPEKFLQALSKLPACAGIALGLDRLLMLCVGAERIAEVLPMGSREL